MKKKSLIWGMSLISSTLIIIGGSYSYVYFGLQNAYKNKNYYELNSLVEKYQYIFPNAYKLVLRSSLEDCIIYNSGASSKLKLVKIAFYNPKMNKYITQKKIENSNEDWIVFYREIEKAKLFVNFANLNLEELEPSITYHHNLAEKASKLEFECKEMFLNSCYVHTLGVNIENIPKIITDHIDPLVYSHIDQNTTLSEWSKNKINKINITINNLKTIKNKYITKGYFEEIEKAFYNSISQNDIIYNQVKKEEDKKAIRKLNKELFESMNLYSQERLHLFPRSPKEIQQYDELKSLIEKYKN